jgi:hypothetical protein
MSRPVRRKSHPPGAKPSKLLIGSIARLFREDERDNAR